MEIYLRFLFTENMSPIPKHKHFFILLFYKNFIVVGIRDIFTVNKNGR